jgi:hypothetical protein
MTTSTLTRNREAEAILVSVAQQHSLMSMFDPELAAVNEPPAEGTPFVFIGWFNTKGVVQASEVLPAELAQALTEAYEAANEHVTPGSVVLTGADTIRFVDDDGAEQVGDEFGNTHVVNATYTWQVLDGEDPDDRPETPMALFGVNVDAGTFELYID